MPLAIASALGNLAHAQDELHTSLTRLSSGLRVQSAADDPSGLAISTSLRVHVAAFDQAAENVQNASNAAQVASGAVQNIQEILQRIRSLAVEAASDVSSAADRQNLQVEAGQLILEINRIAQNTNFNGQPLLDGSHEGFVAAENATATVLQDPALLNTQPITNPPAGAAALVLSQLNTLVLSAQVLTGAAGSQAQAQLQEPQITLTLLQNVVASPGQQTVQVTGAQFIQPGMVLDHGIQVESVDVANGTITGFFNTSLAAGQLVSTQFFAQTSTAVIKGVQTVTISGFGGYQLPIYAGQVIKFPGTPNTMTVLSVVGPNTFVADVSAAAPANSFLNDFNQVGIPLAPPATITINFGIDTDPPPVGSAAYIVASGPGNTGPIAVGTVISVTGNSYVISIPPLPPLPPGTTNLSVSTRIASGSATPTLDGTIELQVVNDAGVAKAQETYYDTAGQTVSLGAALLDPLTRSALFDGVDVTLGNFGPADVGESSFIKVLQATAPVTNPLTPAFQIQSGADEGDQVQLAIRALNASVLRVQNTNLTTFLGSEDAIGQIDYALQKVLETEAELGALVVRLSKDQENDAIASVNLEASASSITDLDVPRETTTLVRESVLVNVGTSIVAQAHADDRDVLILLR